MTNTTRTASQKAVATHIRNLPQSLAKLAAAPQRREPQAPQPRFDFGPISRTEMQAIVAEMIG